MVVGLGVLGLSPTEFWGLTLPELNAKVAGYQERNGIKPGDRPTAAALRADLDQTLEDFPDGPLPKDLWLRHKRNLRDMGLH